jgi:hypothetical protein
MVEGGNIAVQSSTFGRINSVMAVGADYDVIQEWNPQNVTRSN